MVDKQLLSEQQHFHLADFSEGFAWSEAPNAFGERFRGTLSGNAFGSLSGRFL